MQRKLYVTSARHYFHVEGSSAWPSVDPCLIRVVVEVRLPDCVTAPGPQPLPGIRVRPPVLFGTIGEVLVELPPGASITTFREEEHYGHQAASWVRAEIAKRGLEALTVGGPQWLGRLTIPEGAPHLHPDDPGDGVADMDWLG